MNVVYTSVKHALTAATDNLDNIQIGADRQRADIEKYKQLEADIESTILEPSISPSKEYVTAKLADLNSDISQTQPTVIKGGSTENKYAFRSHATHPVQNAAGWILNDRSIIYGQKENSESTLNWKIEKFIRIEKEFDSQTPPEPTGQWILITNATSSGNWVSNYQIDSEVTDSDITGVGLTFTVQGMALSAQAWEFGLEWLHATPSPAANGVNRFYNQFSSHGVKFRLEQTLRSVGTTDMVGNWYAKLDSFRETFASDV